MLRFWPYLNRSAFSVVCDAPEVAIGSALLQEDVYGRERVILF